MLDRFHRGKLGKAISFRTKATHRKGKIVFIDKRPIVLPETTKEITLESWKEEISGILSGAMKEYSSLKNKIYKKLGVKKIIDEWDREYGEEIKEYGGGRDA